ncbi:MAG TPA: tripartite tricarboxylate transporter substrate binding protein [Burkholderiales bacterium]|nr:tripartite tricarboxylate transporter substrate binding protein [Burkholderiales bacterium]
MNSVAAAVGPACVAVLRNLAAVLVVAMLSAAAAAWAQTTSTSSGQAYPSGSMRIVVPFPPGGGTDILARSLAQKLNEAWGVSVIVDNRGGANGTIGAAAVAKAPPDGHTLLVVPSGFAVNPSIYKNLPFDATKDFAPVSQLASSPLVLVVHPSFPPRSVKELIAFLKARPDEINYGSSGNGSPPHLATELFKLLTGTKMTHIPYKGAGPAAVDVIAGQIPIYFMNALQAVPHIKAGRVRALAVTSGARFPGLANLPTIAEAGVPGYAYTNWYGLLAPAGTPRASVSKLQAEVARILNLPDVKERLSAEGALIVAGTPDEFAAFLKREMAQFAKVVKASGMTATN